MHGKKIAAVLAALASSVAGRALRFSPRSASNTTSRLSAAAQSLFDYSMQVQDSRWDDSYKYIWYQDNGPWSVRFTAWYTAGLLARNQGNDLENAKAALENILANQLTDPDPRWYGTYKLSPDEPYPTPDSDLYAPSIYNTYDPNWREFIGTQLVQVVAEFEDLLGAELVGKIETALAIGAVGEMYRNGSYPADDNLITGYSNPGLMRTLTVGWIGHRLNNATFIEFANQKSADILALFTRDGADTLGEYNAPNYYGMDIWALAANIRYGPANATMTTAAKYILAKLWDDIADHYNPYLGNIVGPYDRAYTRDMTEHSAIPSMYWWGIWGREFGPQPPLGEADLLYDVAQGAAIALVADTVAQHISNATAARLTAKGAWAGERFLNKTVWKDLPAVSNSSRQVTSWLSAPLMIGAQTVTEAAKWSAQFTPAIVHWAADPSHTPYPFNAFFSLYATAAAFESEAGPNKLTIRYPNTTETGTDIFTFMLSNVPPSWTLGGKHTITGLEELPCLNVTVTADGLVKQNVTYGDSIEDHRYYNVSYVVPSDFVGSPEIVMDFAYTC